MARIRSVHPSLFTDEAWVSCSPLARILYIGLWTDADDQGLFEWRPLQIKMRLLPADTADASALLSELVGAGLIKSFEAGQTYGAIRDFRKYQRPQKPNAIHPLPDFIADYVHLSPPSTEPVEDRSRTGTVNPPQMEDGGWRMDDEREGQGEESVSCASPAVSDTADAPRAAGASDTSPAEPSGSKPVRPPRKPRFRGLAPAELEEFNQFWAVYPRRVARQAAEEVFARLRREEGVPLDAIIAGAVTYAAERVGEPVRFTKHASGWLGFRRWTDEPAPPSFGSDMAGVAARRRAERGGGMQGYSALDQAIEGIAWEAEESPQ